MSASQSNLSNPAFDYDLVVATTQKSINTGLKNYLDQLKSSEVKVCFVTENHKWVMVPYEELKKRAKGSCPFAPPDGADPDKDQDLINLRSAHYAGGFTAQLGFPDMDDPQSLNVVTLQSGTDTVTFNLLCRSFRITGFLYDPDALWINQSQPEVIPKGHLPWYFSADIKRSDLPIDTNSQLPPAVRTKVQQLQAGTFSLQQMFLDLDTAVTTSTNLTLNGVDSGSPLFIEITSVFVKHYVAEMKKSGQPILGYAVTMHNPDEGSMHLGAVSPEFCALLGPDGNPYTNPTRDQQELTTFNYLCTTKKNAPTAKTFPWNWIEFGDRDAISGIQAFRRSSFGAILQSALGNAFDSRFCLETGAHFGRGGPSMPDAWWFEYHLSFPGHCTFSLESPPQGPVKPTVFVPLLSFSYKREEQTDSGWISSSLNAGRIMVTVNYSFSGTASIGVNKDAVPCIRVSLHAVAQLHLEHWEVTHITHYDNLPQANYVDYTVSIDLPMKVDSTHAKLILESGTPAIQSNSAEYSYWHTGVHPEIHDYMEPYLKKIIKLENDAVRNGFEYISQIIEGAVNGAHGFVFPGGKSFAFSKLSLSDYQDLIIHVSYLDAA